MKRVISGISETSFDETVVVYSGKLSPPQTVFSDGLDPIPYGNGTQSICAGESFSLVATTPNLECAIGFGNTRAQEHKLEKFYVYIIGITNGFRVSQTATAQDREDLREQILTVDEIALTRIPHQTIIGALVVKSAPNTLRQYTADKLRFFTDHEIFSLELNPNCELNQTIYNEQLIRLQALVIARFYNRAINQGCYQFQFGPTYEFAPIEKLWFSIGHSDIATLDIAGHEIKPIMVNKLEELGYKRINGDSYENNHFLIEICGITLSIPLFALTDEILTQTVSILNIDTALSAHFQTLCRLLRLYKNKELPLVSTKKPAMAENSSAAISVVTAPPPSSNDHPFFVSKAIARFTSLYGYSGHRTHPGSMPPATCRPRHSFPTFPRAF